MKKSHGFTLIELMIVIGIIGILAAVAVPAYQNYVIRAKVGEGLRLASAVKTAVSETVATTGAWPTNNTAAGIAAPGDISGNDVSSVSVGTNGVITITYSAAEIAGNTVTMTPTAPGGAVTWTCNSTTIPRAWRPATC